MYEKTKEKYRLSWVDIVKFIGIFAIVWGHTLSDGNVRHFLYSFHVPLFFFVIGLFFTAPKFSFLKFVKKKTVSLLVPYFIFAIISILIFQILGGFAASALEQDISNHSLASNLTDMLYGQCIANRPLWFLPSIFVFYVLCFAIFRFFENKSIFIKHVAAFSIIIVSISACFLNENFLHINDLFWNADVAVFMLAFAIIAFYIKPLFNLISKSLSIILALLLTFLGGVLAFHNSEIAYLNNSYGNVFVFYISATCTILGICFLSICISLYSYKPFIDILVYVGQNTLPILLMHKFPILFFQVIFPLTKQTMKENNASVGFFVSIISIIACLFVDILLKKIIKMCFVKNKSYIQPLK